MVVDVHYQHSGRGCGDELVQEMVLLLNAQFLVVQAVAHAVEQFYDAVRVSLSDGPQPGGEVLFLDKVNASCEGVQGFYGFPVQYDQQYCHGDDYQLGHPVHPRLRAALSREQGKRNGRCNHEEQQYGYEPEVSS